DTATSAAARAPPRCVETARHCPAHAAPDAALAPAQPRLWEANRDPAAVADAPPPDARNAGAWRGSAGESIGSSAGCRAPNGASHRPARRAAPASDTDPD